LLILRLIYLQIVSYEKLKTLSDNNRIRIVRVFANRGMIFDRKGVLIVKNAPSYNLTILKEDVSDLNETLNKISNVIEINTEQVYKG